MIAPHMATMLAVIVTDAPLSAETAQRLLAEAVEDSFNCISVDGHMSTNDSVLLLANGQAGRRAGSSGSVAEGSVAEGSVAEGSVAEGSVAEDSAVEDSAVEDSAVAVNGHEPLAGDDLEAFRIGLVEVCQELARAIPDDGEGATHLVTIDVSGCRSRSEAHRIAKTVADSALVKTAVAGGDPNWGRIVSAVGYAGVAFDPGKLELELNGHLLYREAAPVDFDEGVVSRSIRDQRETSIVLRLTEGDCGIRFWTTDLTAEYVRLNADYRT